VKFDVFEEKDGLLLLGDKKPDIFAEFLHLGVKQGYL